MTDAWTGFWMLMGMYLFGGFTFAVAGFVGLGLRQRKDGDP